MRFAEKIYIPSSAANMAGNIIGEPINIQHEYGFSFHAVWTGTPAGNITIEGSNDLKDPTQWTQVAIQASGGAAGSEMFNLDAQYYKFVRVRYDFTGSTGALNVNYHAKGS